MPRPSKLLSAKDDILAVLSKPAHAVYTKSQLASLLRDYRRVWHLPDHVTTADLITFLSKNGALRVKQFRSEKYGAKITRYVHGKPSGYVLALSFKPNSYLSHGTAAELHGLGRVEHKMIYLNAEQSPKSAPSGVLIQANLDRAFRGHQRESALIYGWGKTAVTQLSGKNTKKLGVMTMTVACETLAVTDLERTLIDIVVRPNYAGGPTHVLAAYRAARARASVERLIVMLRKLDHLYPYHQAIGFLMEAADYPKESCAALSALGFGVDFYLCHGLKNPAYSPTWRLHYPQDLTP
jgi:hypothetical protein